MNSPVPSAETRPIQLYRDARALDQQDALNQSAPRALTNLLAAAMQDMSASESLIGTGKGEASLQLEEMA